MTRPPNPLHRLLPHQRLRPRLRTRLRENQLLPQPIIRIRLNIIHLRRHHRRFILLLGLLGWIAGTILAPCMLALSTDLVVAECGVAFVTGAMDTHPNRLLDSVRLFIWAC